MKVNITITPPHDAGKFATIALSFAARDGAQRSVHLNINFQPLYDYHKDTKSVAFDLFLIASLVYGIDNLLARDEYSIDGWARDIEVSFPVQNLAVWQQVETSLQETLSFLTGDYWAIRFESLGSTKLFKDKTTRRVTSIPVFHHNDYVFASLFSGGLDSLVGVINELAKLPQKKKGLLVSHFDSSSPGTNKDQESLNTFLAQPSVYGNNYDWLQVGVYLSNQDNSGNDLNKEPSLRSRSLLFNAIGAYCVERMPHCNTLIIPENGTISLNFPLTPSRSSTLSTRTTHPYFLERLGDLVAALGLTTSFDNPYMTMTKGELVASCANNAVLKSSYKLSVSCGKRGRKMNWDTKAGTQHCGVCMPCIYRRAALHKKGWDDQLYGIDIFTTRKPILSIPDMPALFDFLNRKLTTEQIQRTLLVSGSLNMGDLGAYAHLVETVIDEIKQWMRDKGNANVKKLAGIK